MKEKGNSNLDKMNCEYMKEWLLNESISATLSKLHTLPNTCSEGTERVVLVEGIMVLFKFSFSVAFC